MANEGECEIAQWQGFTERKESVAYFIDWVLAQKASLDFAALTPTLRGRPLNQSGLIVPQDPLVSSLRTHPAPGWRILQRDGVVYPQNTHEHIAHIAHSF